MTAGVRQPNVPSDPVRPRGLRHGLQLGLLGVALGSASIATGYFLATREGETQPAATSAAAAASSPTALVAERSSAGHDEVPAATAHERNERDTLRWPLWAYQLMDPLPVREPPLTPVPWRLLGAAFFDGQWHAIVQRQGVAQPDYYKTGDKLPGGYLIQEITQEDLTLRAGHREIVLSYIGSR